MSFENTFPTRGESSSSASLVQNALSSPSTLPISREHFFEYVKRQEEIELSRSEATLAIIEQTKEIERTRSEATIANIYQLLFGFSQTDRPEITSSSTPQSSGGSNVEIKIEEVHSTTARAATPNTAIKKTNHAHSTKPNATPSSSRPIFNSGYNRSNSSSAPSSSSGAMTESFTPVRRELPNGGTQTERSQYCGGVEVLQLNCENCSTIVSTEAQLKVHLQLKHKINPCRCLHQSCGQSFLNSYQLMQHVQGKHAGLMSCKKCLKEYKTPGRLEKHHAMIHQKGLYQCSLCRLTNQKLKEANDHFKKCGRKGAALLQQQPNFVRQTKQFMKLRGHAALN